MARSLVGLDLSPGELRAAEVRGGRVRRLATLATDAIDERGELIDHDLLAGDIRRLWKLGHFRSRSAIVGLTSSSIAARPVEFPRVAPEDARSAARFEVEELLAFSLDDAFVGVEVWPDSPDEAITRALVIAAPSSMITSVMATLADAHLQPVDLRLSAVSVAQTMSKGIAGGVVVADVGASRSSVAICENGSIRLVRQLSIGAEPGTSVTEELELELGRIQGFRRDGSASRREQPSEDELRLGPVVEAVRSSIEFHLGQRHAVSVEQMVVTGTHRHSPGLAERLAGVLGLPVAIAPALTERGRADAAAALVVDLRTSDLSLLPTAIGAARRYRRALVGSVAAAVIIGIGLFNLSSRSAAEIDDLASRADGLDREYAATTDALTDLEPIVEADREASSRRDDVTSALEGDLDWRQVLAETTNAMPADSWLTAFRGQRSAPTIGDTGTVIDRTGDVSFSGVGIDQTTVGRWLISVSAVPGLAEPRLTQSTLSAVGPFGSSRVLFTINSDLDTAAESDRRARELGEQE